MRQITTKVAELTEIGRLCPCCAEFYDDSTDIWGSSECVDWSRYQARWTDYLKIVHRYLSWKTVHLTVPETK